MIVSTVSTTTNNVQHIYPYNDTSYMTESTEPPEPPKEIKTLLKILGMMSKEQRKVLMRQILDTNPDSVLAGERVGYPREIQRKLMGRFVMRWLKIGLHMFAMVQEIDSALDGNNLTDKEFEDLENRLMRFGLRLVTGIDQKVFVEAYNEVDGK